MPELVYRRAGPEDLEAVVELEARCFATPWTRESLASELARAASQVELALDHDERLLGLSCVWVVGDEWQLQRIETDPGARERGVGTALLRRAVERAREAGARVMTLEVASANARACELYARAGFVEVGRRPGYYKTPPDDAVLMTLEL